MDLIFIILGFAFLPFNLYFGLSRKRKTQKIFIILGCLCFLIAIYLNVFL